MSRATLWRATSSRPGSSDVRITDCSSLSGFAIAQHPPARRRRRDPQALDRVRRDEAEVTASLRPRPRSRSSTVRRSRCSRDSPPIACRRAGSVAGRRCEPVNARDLLDHVGLAMHVVVAPVGHLGVEVVVALAATPKPSRSRIALRLGGLDALAEQAARAARVRSAIRCGSGLGRGDVDRAGHHARAAQLDHQPRREPLRLHRERGDAAASRSARSPRCAGRASSRSGGCSARSRSPPPSPRASCSAETSLRGAAHDPADARRALRVADEHRVAVERRAPRRRAS